MGRIIFKLVWFLIGSFFLIRVIVLTINLYDEKENIEINIKIGDTLIHSYNWDEKNPFEKTEIDTIIINDIRGGYVQWYKINANRMLSTKREYLIVRIKQLEYEKHN